MAIYKYQRIPSGMSWEMFRGCVSKTRYSIEPSCTANMYAYACRHCQGWHKATRRDERGGIAKPQNGWCNGLEYRDGYPIVPPNDDS